MLGVGDRKRVLDRMRVALALHFAMRNALVAFAVDPFFDVFQLTGSADKPDRGVAPYRWAPIDDRNALECLHRRQPNFQAVQDRDHDFFWRFHILWRDSAFGYRSGEAPNRF